jgi:hypothetical protein
MQPDDAPEVPRDPRAVQRRPELGHITSQVSLTILEMPCHRNQSERQRQTEAVKRSMGMVLEIAFSTVEEIIVLATDSGRSRPGMKRVSVRFTKRGW